MNPEIYLTPSGLLVRNVAVMDRFIIVSNEFLPHVEFSDLVSVLADVNLSGNVGLVSIILPALTDVATFVRMGFNASNCPALTTVSFPNYLPSNKRAQNFSGCALTEASVDHILARAVASTGYVSGTINLSGGTSAAPSATGQADKAALISRGCVVLTN